jgi:DNA-binding transcriptional LysR family regulator
VQTAKGFNTNFDMVDLPLLVNIGEQQSLTHGAERSHLSLPSASVRIKTMEESVGTRLLLRSKQGTTLTPAGNVALQHARLVSRPDRKHDGDLLEYGDGLKGHVRLFANATSISGSLPEVLRRYLTENPRVDVDLRERLSDEGVRAVAEGAADIAIVAGETNTNRLETIPYATEELVLITASGHPLAQRERVDFSDARVRLCQLAGGKRAPPLSRAACGRASPRLAQHTHSGRQL